ncbi:unnamed protein product [Dovyalis caffra]|uniref:Late embryogenesis abundant protein LEA-2 subgroup domain-containing protein n=1 Tax=Dovyalis caffra TaxID=77055 RepID=A0AAV1STV8_9ROSI|nr:unnamed protein product [Dovyalis caffra]
MNCANKLANYVGLGSVLYGSSCGPLNVIAIGVAALVVIFILKPQEPRFSLEKIKVNSYKLSAYSNSTLFISSVVSLILNAQNHNKVGIKYSPSSLHIFHQGIPIGLIRVPQFYQAAHSDNVGITTQISLPRLNVTQIFDQGVSKEKAMKNVVQMKVLGDVRLHLQLSHLTLPKIKVALECDIDFNYREFAFRDELFATKVVQDLIIILGSFAWSSYTFIGLDFDNHLEEYYTR